MKVLTFSRFYPRKHPKVGEATFFVEKILRNFWQEPKWCNSQVQQAVANYAEVMGRIANVNHFAPKLHTIRAGNRWKAGEWFSPRVWTGQPYCSKQIEFAPPIMIEKIYEVEISFSGANIIVAIPNGDGYSRMISASDIAKNDGLTVHDFIDWFKIHPKKKESFVGQIICWSNKIQY